MQGRRLGFSRNSDFVRRAPHDRHSPGEPLDYLGPVFSTAVIAQLLLTTLEHQYAPADRNTQTDVRSLKGWRRRQRAHHCLH
jgi:hypothetical protein